MTDEEFVLSSTNRERKVIGYSSRAKKNGSKSRFVRLPSDTLSAKQKKELNGEVMNYSIKGATWESFRKFPVDVQQLALSTYAEKGACISDVAHYLGVTDTCIRNFIKAHPAIKVTFRNGKQNQHTPKSWLDFVADTAPVEVEGEPTMHDILEAEKQPVADTVRAKQEEVLNTYHELAKAVKETPPIMAAPVSGNVIFEGTGDQICNAIKAMLMNGKFRVKIMFEPVGGAYDVEYE